MTEVTWKDSGIDTIAKMRGQEGRRLARRQRARAVRRAARRTGSTRRRTSTIVTQPFDMNLFLNGEVDAAAAMTYNELAQVLESKNPNTGKLYTLNDLNVFKMSDLGTGMLEDGIFVREDWIKDTANQDIAKVPEGVVPGLDLLPRPLRGLRADRAQQRPDARRGPPALADERDQRADLAERRRDRRDEPGRLRRRRRRSRTTTRSSRRASATRTTTDYARRPSRARGRRAWTSTARTTRSRTSRSPRAARRRNARATLTEEGRSACPF